MRHAAVGMMCSGFLAIGCARPAPAPAAPDAAAIHTAIDAQLAKIAPVFSKKDASALAPIFTDDATWILPDASTFKGKDAIVKGATAFFTTYDSISSPSETIDKLIVVNDSEAVTFTSGKYKMWLKGKKAAEQHVNPFADYWKKGADGVWRIAYEVNAEGMVPAPAPAPTSGTGSKKKP